MQQTGEPQADINGDRHVVGTLITDGIRNSGVSAEVLFRFVFHKAKVGIRTEIEASAGLRRIIKGGEVAKGTSYLKASVKLGDTRISVGVNLVQNIGIFVKNGSEHSPFSIDAERGYNTCLEVKMAELPTQHYRDIDVHIVQNLCHTCLNFRLRLISNIRYFIQGHVARHAVA